MAGKYLTAPENLATTVFLCPFDPGAKESDSYIYRSYAYNIEAPETEELNANLVQDPARTIMLSEWYYPDPNYQTKGRSTWIEDGWNWRRSGGIYPHHPDGKSGVLFYDMHVELVKAAPDLPRGGDGAIKWSFGPMEP